MGGGVPEGALTCLYGCDSAVFQTVATSCEEFVTHSSTIVDEQTRPSWGGPRAARTALTVLLLIYGLAILREPGFAAIDNVNLPIHEAGHIVFGGFGELVAALGGTIFQLLVPAVFLGYFLRRRDQHSASVALWWFAENLWYVAVYVGDAQEQALPLVGGGEHDWAFILAELDVLQSDDTIASFVRFVGGVLFLVSILWGLATAGDPAGVRQPRAATSG